MESLASVSFWLKEVTFLGNVVFHDRIMVDQRKIEVVRNFPRPLYPLDIRSFLGLAKYYRRFVEGFSSIASPLTKLTQRKAKFQGSNECEKIFQTLKDQLTLTLILTFP